MNEKELDALVRRKVELTSRGKDLEAGDVLRLVLGQIEMNISLEQDVKYHLLKGLRESGNAAGLYLESLFRVVGRVPTRPGDKP